MLFNSLPFILGFLPITLLVYLFINKYYVSAKIYWLIAASLFFYSWWKAEYIFIIISSIIINYILSYYISFQKEKAKQSKICFLIGIIFNLVLLGYYKYSDFAIGNINRILGLNIDYLELALPLAISFFTIQQIAYLVDSYEGLIELPDFHEYCLFVCFFPQLLAGPIVHINEMLPQIKAVVNKDINLRYFFVGIMIFTMGLFKKSILADSISIYADTVFEAARMGNEIISLFEAWGGAFAYSFQLYFDFSGYSDMAIGLGLLFGIVLPVNFNSPFKSQNIIQFWQRWHITLSKFITTYLYTPFLKLFPRISFSKAMIATFWAFLIAGVWHGAAWKYICFGVLHGSYLVINHTWHHFIRKPSSKFGSSHFDAGRLAGIGLTFVCVVISFVIFRAHDMSSAMKIFQGMAGFNGAHLPDYYFYSFRWLGPVMREGGVLFDKAPLFLGVSEVTWILTSFFICFLMPNSLAIAQTLVPPLGGKTMKLDRPLLFPFVRLELNWQWGIMGGSLFALALLSLTKVNEFIYFQF
ncbi:MAG: MBOAT family protein [Desulfobacter sp.]|nr:MAG: MBOAT family protein [Desulfobacter sp.]